MSVQERDYGDLRRRQLDDAARLQQMAGDSQAYYVLLSERLEKILVDMRQSGTSLDNALMHHFSGLLNETRDLMRKRRINTQR